MFLQMFFKIGDSLNLFAKAVSSTLLCLMTMTMILEVIWRNIFMSLTWSEEAATTFFGTWFIFLGGSVALRASQLISIDFVVSLLPKRIGRVVITIGELMTVVFLIVVILNGIEMVALTLEQPSPALMIPMGYAYLAIPVGCFFMLYQTIVVMLLGKSMGGGGIDN